MHLMSERNLLIESKRAKRKLYYGASRSALELIGRHRGDGSAASAFVRNPIKRIFGCILAITP